MAIQLLDIEEYVINRLKEIAPDVNTAPGSGVRDLLISPLSAILQPLANEIHRVKKSQSLVNAGSLSDEDVDAILANIFVSRDTGSLASGTATLILSRSAKVVVPAGTIFIGRNGLQFFARTTTIAQPGNLVANSSTGNYEIDVIVDAKAAGAQYNIDKGEITGVVIPDTNVIGARNKAAFTGGSVRETSESLIARARASIGARDLSTKRGADIILKSVFDDIQKVNVVGFGDADMIRDKIYAPSITIDNITYPASDGVSIGGKVDIYTLTGIQSDEIEITNPASVSYDWGKNTIAFYSGSDTEVKYEGTDGCPRANKPITDIISITPDQAWSTGGLLNTSFVLTEDRDYVWTSNSPGKGNSVDEEKQLKFIRGSGTVVAPSYNSAFNSAVEGFYYPLDTYVDGEHLSTRDIRAGEDLLIIGATSQEIIEIDLFTADGSTDAYRSLNISPSLGTVQTGGVLVRKIHVTTGRQSDIIESIYQNENQGFTVAGWANLRSYPATDERRTLFNIYGMTNHTEIPELGSSTLEDIVHAYVDSDGKVHFDTKSDGLPIVEHVTSQAGLFPPDSGAGTSNWRFFAFTYDAASHTKMLYTSDITNREISVANWDTNQTNIDVRSLDYDEFGTQMTIGSVDASEIDIFNSNPGAIIDGISQKNAFDGLIDGLHIYSRALSFSEMSDIVKRQNTVTIRGLENSTIPTALESIVNEYGSKSLPILRKGVVLMITGRAAGQTFEVVDNTQPFDPQAALEMTLRSLGSSSTNEIAEGDKYALLPYAMQNLSEDQGYTTDLNGDKYPVLSAAVPGTEQRIGIGIELNYYYGKIINDIQNFVNLTDTRPANVDFLVKHTFPVFVSGTLDVRTNQSLSEDEILSEVNAYIDGIDVGGEFSVSDFVNHMFEKGITYIKLPLDFTFSSRGVEFQKNTVSDIDDTISASNTQYFVPGSIVVTIN